MKESKHNVIPSTNFNNKIPAVILMGIEMCSPGILLMKKIWGLHNSPVSVTTIPQYVKVHWTFKLWIPTLYLYIFSHVFGAHWLMKAEYSMGIKFIYCWHEHLRGCYLCLFLCVTTFSSSGSSQVSPHTGIPHTGIPFFSDVSLLWLPTGNHKLLIFFPPHWPPLPNLLHWFLLRSSILHMGVPKTQHLDLFASYFIHS